MRIATVSDLHTDYAENRQLVVALATEIHRLGADIAIIAGDVSHKNDRIRRVLTAFREVARTVAYVPGNHDVWFDVPNAPARADLNTWVRYRDELREVADEAGAHYLPAAPLVQDGVAIVGSCGWYDYSFVLPSLRGAVNERVLSTKQMDGIMWADARLTAFRDEHGALMPDADVARRMEADIGAQLDDVAQRADVKDVVAVTHHQAFEAAVRRTGTLPWEFFNAFMGSTSMGERIRACPKVRAAVYGHTHFCGDRMIDGIRVYGTPLGYPRERRGLSEEQIVASRIGWIEL